MGFVCVSVIGFRPCSAFMCLICHFSEDVKPLWKICDDFLHIFSYFNHLEIPEILVVHCTEKYFNVIFSTVLALVHFSQFVSYIAESVIFLPYS